MPMPVPMGKSELPAGFRVCVYHEGEVKQCPENYPDKETWFADVDDGRTCSACACSQPVGSLCSAMISVYTDGACQHLQAGNIVTSDSSFCVPIATPDVSFGSKSASPPTYTPGTCAPLGGEPGGAAVPIGPSTFCCR